MIEARIAKAGLRIQPGVDVEIYDPEDDPRFRQYWEAYHQLMGRDGITPEGAKSTVRRSNTVIAALMVHLGDADAMLCGLVSRSTSTWPTSKKCWATKPVPIAWPPWAALMLDNRTLFIADTYINEDPAAEELAQIAKMAADEVARFGLPPRWLSSRTATTARPLASRH